MAFLSYMQSVGAWSLFAMDGVYEWDSTSLHSANLDYYGYALNKVFNVDGTQVIGNSYGLNSVVNPARDAKNIDWLMAGVWAVSQSKDILDENTQRQFTDYSLDNGLTWSDSVNKKSYSWNALNDKKLVVMHKINAANNKVLVLAYNGFNDLLTKQTIKIKINNKIFDIDIFGQYTSVMRIDLT